MRYFTLLLLLYSSFSAAQVTIKGVIVDERHKPVAGVNVFLQGTIEGTSTDEAGAFSFVSRQKGKAVLMCMHLSMKDVAIPFEISGEVKPFQIVMEEKASELEEVVVSAATFGISDKQQATVLNPMEVQSTPSADGGITGAVVTLPGTQQVGESGQVFVRGGSGDETKVTIDGLNIPNPYYAGVPDVAQRSRFSPHLFKGIVFNTGGYSAQFGEALSSVLVLETKDQPSKPSATVALIPYGALVGKEWLNKRETTSWGGMVGYYNFKPYYELIKQNVEWLKAPETVTFSGTFRQSTGGNGILKWYGFGNWTRQATARESLQHWGTRERYESDDTNGVSLVTYTRDIAPEWRMYAGYGLHFDRNKVTESHIHSDAYTLHQQFRLMTSGKLTRGLKAEVGTEGFIYNDDHLSDYETALWATTSWQLSRKWILLAGLRTEYDDVLNKAVVLSRFSVAYKTGRYHQLNLSAGDYSQKPAYNYLALDRHLDYQRARHYIADFQYAHEKRFLRAEVYYKDYRDLLLYPTPTTLSNGGEGYATGFDFFWRDGKSIKGLDYWVSYTYLDTQRRYLRYPVEAQPTFATPHTAHLVVKYFIESAGLFFGASYTVASGRPYENPNNPVFLADRTPTYQNTNFNVALLRKWGNTFNTFVLSVSNVLGTKQVFNYRYTPDGAHRIAVGLPYDRAFMIGWFISIGQNRSQEVLDQLQ
ncbi:TonB-dependent receptor [Capnocytophaga haemolytica]